MQRTGSKQPKKHTIRFSHRGNIVNGDYSFHRNAPGGCGTEGVSEVNRTKGASPSWPDEVYQTPALALTGALELLLAPSL